MQPQRHVHVKVNRHGVMRRRDFFRDLAAFSAAAGCLGWTDLVKLRAEDLRRRGRACILLWMQGGPSQFETLDPKPGHDNGGQTKAIDTSVPGIQIADNLPRLATVMQHVALVRSLTSREGSHPRATSLLHTGYLPTASIKYPTLGAIAAHEIRDPACQLPAFVQIGGGGFGGGGGGFLGPDYNPFVVNAAGRLPDNTQVGAGEARFRRRLGLLDRLQADYAAHGGGVVVENQKRLYDKAANMILSPEIKAFELDQESAATRQAYGSSPFAAGCLLARRLVEAGVTFVEVVSNGWDTHDNNFERCKTLTASIDQPMAQLITDLEQRGLLDSTLVIWMGEFGRTPRINPRTGRDHYPRAFSAALAGAGIRGGQVIGRTDTGGENVADRPINVNDLFQTFCKALRIDAAKENMSSIGRPIKIVDGGQPVDELFG